MRRFVLPLMVVVGAGLLVGGSATGDPPATCKTFGMGAKCCDPAIAAHLTRDAVYAACGESDATFLGEQAGKNSCTYYFKVEGEKEENTFVQVYAPPQKDVPSAPNDPFFKWGRVGKVFITERAMSPKSAPMIANSTGLWLPAKDYFVSVNASTKVCTKPEAKKLAARLK